MCSLKLLQNALSRISDTIIFLLRLYEIRLIFFTMASFPTSISFETLDLTNSH